LGFLSGEEALNLVVPFALIFASEGVVPPPPRPHPPGVLPLALPASDRSPPPHLAASSFYWEGVSLFYFPSFQYLEGTNPPPPQVMVTGSLDIVFLVLLRPFWELRIPQPPWMRALQWQMAWGPFRRYIAVIPFFGDSGRSFQCSPHRFCSFFLSGPNMRFFSFAIRFLPHNCLT